jgi:transposase InsO family protein
MDGRGRAMDNIFTERLWRSLKYEEVYLKDYRVVREARQGIGDYFHLYNTRRPHQSLLSDTGRGILWKEELMAIMYVIVYRAVT